MKMTKTNLLIKELKEAGYTITKIEPATPQTDACVSLEKGFHITCVRGGFMLGMERDDGCFVFYPVRKTVELVITDLRNNFPLFTIG